MAQADSYFWLDSVDTAIARVAARVSKGGHDIPEKTIRRRYGRSIQNLFELYIPIADVWRVYDNSNAASTILVAEGVLRFKDTVHVADTWAQMKECGNG